MHRKVQSLVLAGMISANALGSATTAFANNNLKTSKNVKIERTVTRNTETPTAKEHWNYDVENNVVVIKGYTGTDERVVIPREIDGMPVELENLNSDMFPNIKHISIEKGNSKVKLRAANLDNAFKDNTDLVSVNLQGLDTTELTNLNGTFEGCTNLSSIDFNDWNVDNVTDFGNMFKGTKNLTFVDLTDWEIDNDDNIQGMFRLTLAESSKDVRILVVTNDLILSNVAMYQAHNRYPSFVTFEGNGGHFMGNTNILNMAAPRYTVDSYDLNHLEDILEYDMVFAGKPSQEGLEFKGWYSETNPTNIYEFFNMTYKAKWGPVGVDMEEDGTINAELVNGTGGRRTPYVINIYNEAGFNTFSKWLNNKRLVKDFYRY